MILQLHHVQITIPKGEEDTAREFYCHLLGLLEVAKPESLAGRGGFWLQIGAIQIHVGTEDDIDRSKTKAHIAYEVDDLAAMQEKLKQKNVVVLDSVPILGYTRCEIRDPFGNRVEFIQAIE